MSSAVRSDSDLSAYWLLVDLRWINLIFAAGYSSSASATSSQSKIESERNTSNARLHFLPDYKSMAPWFGPIQPFKSIQFTSCMRWKNINTSHESIFYLTFVVIKICATFTTMMRSMGQRQGDMWTRKPYIFFKFHNIKAHAIFEFLYPLPVLLHGAGLKHRCHEWGNAKWSIPSLCFRSLLSSENYSSVRTGLQKMFV